jgi:sulfhydrogenase subunit delta
MTRVGFVQLSSCSGCMFAVLGNTVFPDLLKSSDVRLFKMISDVQVSEQLDILFVEGGVSSEKEAEYIRKMYSSGAKIVALGTCAVLGGVMSQSKNMFVHPISNYVDVHTYLPGCPPPQRLLGNLLLTTLEGLGFQLSEKNVCAECPYALDQDYSTEIKYLQPQNTVKCCFLREGVLCLGPVTRAGCEAHCIENGAPCDGCFGSISRDMPSAIANLFSVMKVSPEIREYASLAFRYQKPELIKE